MFRRPTPTPLWKRSLEPASSPDRLQLHLRPSRGALQWLRLLVCIAPIFAGTLASAEEPNPCEAGATLATGSPDIAIFAREASRGVRAFWCETYDVDGNARRAGAYWEIYPGGATRTLARYVDSRIEGPVEVFDEAGGIWLRGELAGGDWMGALEMFHANGGRWLSALFRAGQLDGPVETWYPDGSVESATRFLNGREDGIATSYYPAVAGGRLRSQVRVEADEIVENAPRPMPADSEGESNPSPIAQVSADPGT